MAKREEEQQVQPDVIQRPTKYTTEVPHEDTLGALAGAPADVAEEYSRTGKTPDGEWRKSQVVSQDEEQQQSGRPARRHR